MKLAYRAFDTSGREVVDTIDAADTTTATETLRRRGLYVTGIGQSAASSSPAARKPALKTKSRGNLKDLAVFARQLYVLVASGTPLVESLQALQRQVKEGPWRDVLAHVRDQVEQGLSLSEAMEEHPDYFDTICRSLIAAGESSGNLPEILDRLASLSQKRLHVRNAIVGAMIYPSLLVVVAVSVLVLLLAFVVPRFAELFESLDVPLPGTTRTLVLMGEMLRSYWWALIIAVAGLATGAKAWLRTPAGRYAMDGIILKLPQIGNIVRSFATAHITRFLGILMDSHVPVQEALRLTRQATGNTRYVELMTKAEEQVTRGEPISSAFADSDLISPTIYESIRNGEQTGQLGALLLNMADFLEEDNEVIVRSLVSIVEPVILIFMGILVAFVAMSMFLPMFDLTSMTGGGG